MEVLTTIGHLIPIVETFDVIALLLLMVDVACHVGFKCAACILDGLHLLIEDVAIDVLGLKNAYLADKSVLV